MCAYATFEELNSAYGVDRVRRMFAKQPAEGLQSYVERRLEAGAGFMDLHLAKVYSTPIDITVPALGSPGRDQKLRLAAMLSDINICITLYQLTSGSSDLRNSIKEHYLRCVDVLERVMVGEVALPGISQSRRIFSVVGPCGQGPLADPPLLRREDFSLHRVLEDFEAQ